MLYPDIFDWMHLLFTQVHLLFDSSAEGQYVTVCFTSVWIHVILTALENHYATFRVFIRVYT